MRRLLACVAALCALLVLPSGCGDDSASSLDDALGYLPKDAPLVLVFDTDVDGEQYDKLNELLGRFPLGDQLPGQLRGQFEDRGGVDYEDDVKPILGNDAVLGFPTVESIEEGDARAYVWALEARDGDKAEELARQDAREVGEKDGTKIYESESGGTFSAVEDSTFLMSNRRDVLEDAIGRRGGDDRLREEEFRDAFEGLPEDAILRVYSDLEKVLQSSPDTEPARRVEWVAALRKFGMTATVEDDGIAVQFRAATEGDLQEADLPMAAGGESPPVVQLDNEVGLGLRNLTQVIKFGETAAQASDPTEFGQYQAAKNQFGESVGINVDNDVYGQFSGNATMSVTLDGKFALRSELRDPAAFETTLEKIADNPEALRLALEDESLEIEKPSGDEKLYTLDTDEGDDVVLGVIDGVFVLASDPEKAEQIAAATPEPVEGAEGAFAMKADGEAIAAEIVSKLFGSQLGGIGSLFGGIDAFTEPVGDVVGSTKAEPGAISGRYKLFVEE